jgi:hypothetical protein
MRLYRVDAYFDREAPLSKVIEVCFRNFSLKERDLLFLSPEDDVIFTDFDEAIDFQNWTGDDISGMMVIEYDLTENDLLFGFFNKYCESSPTNVWYYWWDPEENHFKEIKKQLLGFA